jgi:hypothetical protein
VSAAGNDGAQLAASAWTAVVTHPLLAAARGSTIIIDVAERITDCCEIPADTADGATDGVATGDGYGRAQQQGHARQLFDPSQRHQSYPTWKEEK